MERKNRCCIATCTGERFDLAHRFPRSHELTQSWLQAIDSQNLRNINLRKLSDCYQVCARHFLTSDYRHPNSRNLNKLAVPSLNLKDLSQLHLARDSTPRGVENASVQTDSSTMKPLSINDGTDEEADNVPVELVECIEMYSNECDYDIKKHQLKEGERNNISFKITEFSSVFEIEHPKYEKPVYLNAFWLRFNCECSDCFDLQTYRKKINFMDIPEYIRPKEIFIEPLDTHTLFIEWEDDHNSTYDLEDVLRNQTSKECLFSKKLLFDSITFKETPQTEFSKLVCFDDTVEKVFVNLILHGFVCVTGISTQNASMAKLAIQRLFPHQQNLNFDVIDETHSEVCSNITYANIDSGLKCFFSTHKSEVLLVDGLNVAEQLKKSDTFAFDRLIQTPVLLKVRDNNIWYEKLGHVIDYDDEIGEIIRIQLDTQIMGSLNMLPQLKIHDFYDSLKLFMTIIRTDKNQILLSLEPGTMIILDNWRVLHKLSSNIGIWQCYLNRNDYIGRARYLGIL
ncbi:trimethyllysine dioxygenase, mitochondrial-like isoform X2 [Eupeodes corollae]|uniref:trimethyllysine dioxygenase, mitochondrial-like isoform X2 n=1 Tax=Eupeodes corollae TaxID=290404 RepID=UPI0024931C57|nr:trimethyllysine dioxygenase, mitochondrial-like isoform X2 [Eupeodes corollae]